MWVLCNIMKHFWAHLSAFIVSFWIVPSEFPFVNLNKKIQLVSKKISYLSETFLYTLDSSMYSIPVQIKKFVH